jgi:hypothetical protein
MVKSKRPKGCSDSMLMDLWRKAVRKKWEYHCVFAGDMLCAGEVQCHHIKKRRIPHLRYHPKNGILLCEYHHALAEYEVWRQKIRARIGPETCGILDDLEMMLFKNYLKCYELTRDEFHHNIKRILEDILEE